MKKNGEITAFLSLVFLLMLSFAGAIVESASLQVNKNEKRADVSRATESVFAEYQRDILEEYDIFAVDESYETGTVSEQNILNRLAFYGAENRKTDIEKIRYLTDNSGQDFYIQAVNYMCKKYGMDVAGGLIGSLNVWKEQEKDSEEYEKENLETSQELNRLLEEEQQELPEENNPISVISDIRSGGILNLVLPEEFVLSEAAVSLVELPSHRTLQKGRGEFAEKELTSLAPFFFDLYLLEKFSSAKMEGTQATEVEEDGGIKYELEYLISGKESDKENLEETAKKLVFMRFAPNYAFLLTDEEKQLEAETLALSLCTLITLPEITEIAKHAILLAWAYGESIMDVRALLAGRKVGLVKTKETWKLGLTSLLTLKESPPALDESTDEGGYGYERYLQMLLLLKEKEVLAMRGIDMVELDMNKKKGKTFFKADACVTKLGLRTVCSLRRGVTYSFTSKFEYQ